MTDTVTSPGRLDGRRYDVIIVGAGMSGSLVAKRLGAQGWRVLVLEGGNGGTQTWPGYLDSLDTFHSAAIKVPNSAYRHNAAAPSPDVLDLSPIPGGDGYRTSGYFLQNGRLPYGTDYLRVLGGSAMHWLGAVPRMHPTDFQTETLYGYGRDWPIDPDEMQRYYARAEHEIGVAGDAAEQREWLRDVDDPDDPSVISDPHYRYPMHKIPPSHIDDVFRKIDDTAITEDVGGQTVNLHVTALPQARTSTPDPEYDGGAGYRPTGAVGLPNYGERCVGNASCVPICPVQAKWTPLRLQAQWSDSVTLATRSVVSRVLLGEGGHVRGVEYRAYGDPATPVSDVYTAEADIVVLAGHAIENARLMLTSRLAPNSGQLGRNLMDHPTMLAWALMPSGNQVGPFRGPGHTSGYESFRFGDARRVRSPFRIEISNWGWGWPMGAPFSNVAAMLRIGGDAAGEVLELDPALDKFGPALRKSLGETIGRQISLQIAVEQPANPSNTVTIAPRDLDAMGNPRPVITYDLDEHVKKGIYAARQVSMRIFDALRAVDRTDYGPAPDGTYPVGHFAFAPDETSEPLDLGYRGAGHGAGTHIMGTGTGDSVVNSDQRTHEHPNLYAVGCGSMPSVGTSNPSLTMAALTLRSADAIHRHLVGLHRPVNLSAPSNAQPSAQPTGVKA
ncbi:GMC family oxidoreductase [Actinomadura sp. KC06]|uniref:GMC oxidoreductase n=1 Tax=Actinomadura sp. KC06 TaxID=2530369 RepID=UPI00104B7F65|nr:GMC family oxidoreductase [Actinomadura sp. KC06]TDD38653.1 GMC family oxidoreductase [Actinomadura sp. KC06]